MIDPELGSKAQQAESIANELEYFSATSLDDLKPKQGLRLEQLKSDLEQICSDSLLGTQELYEVDENNRIVPV